MNQALIELVRREVRYKENRHFSVRYFPTGDEQDLTAFLKFYLDTSDFLLIIKN